MEPDPDRYFLKLAAAFVRGRYAVGDAVALEDSLRAKRLDDLSEQELARIFQSGLDAGHWRSIAPAPCYDLANV